MALERNSGNLYRLTRSGKTFGGSECISALFSGTDAIRSAFNGSDRDVYRGFCAYLWHRAHRKENAKATVIMQIYGIIGYPLGHSCSPRYFNEKFQKENIAAEYRSFEMPDIRQLPTLLQQTPDLCGFNVTIPHKQNILPFLDEISEEAQHIYCISRLKSLMKW